jgi:hypothetical protein
LTGVGPVQVKQPRVLDRRGAEEAEPFSSKILPPYLRKTKSLEELIPWLYPTTREQRCWVHTNVLDKLPKRLQPEAKEKPHQIWMAATRADAE